MDTTKMILPGPTGRTDAEKIKRIELQVHTTKSAEMELPIIPVLSAAQAIQTAEAWGQEAIAITDRSVLTLPPEACRESKLKIIGGTELYMVNDLDASPAFHGESNQTIQDEVICIGLESTGLNAKTDRIIELSAVLWRQGEKLADFHSYIQAEVPELITELTGITNEMLQGAPSEEAVLRSFLDFIGDRPLVAHNAEFTESFLVQAMQRNGKILQNAWIDTLGLAQILLPDLPQYTLQEVCAHLGIETDQGSTEAYLVGQLFSRFAEQLRELQVQKLSEINGLMAKLRVGQLPSRKMRPTPINILVRNQEGLENLLYLLELSQQRVMRGKPTVLKSEVNKLRNGLLIGSGTESGELQSRILRYVKDGIGSMDVLQQVASWYDYLMLQPVSYSETLIRQNDRMATGEELREITQMILAIGKSLGKPVCATGNVALLGPEDEAKFRSTYEERVMLEYDECNLPYLRTTKEMLEEFCYFEAADRHKVVVEDPRLIAASCDDIRILS